jgi:hypothetical protein
MRRRGASVERGRLASDLASLPHLARHALRERWQEAYGAAPPAHFGRDLMVRAIAYRLQEQALGGLSAAARRALAQFAEVAADRSVHASPPRQIKPGARLLREWHCVTHEAIILDDGVLFRGRRYASLSEVARIITGSRWSGPKFFGLNGAGRGKTS